MHTHMGDFPKFCHICVICMHVSSSSSHFTKWDVTTLDNLMTQTGIASYNTATIYAQKLIPTSSETLCPRHFQISCTHGDPMFLQDIE